MWKWRRAGRETDVYVPGMHFIDSRVNLLITLNIYSNIAVDLNETTKYTQLQ